MRAISFRFLLLAGCYQSTNAGAVHYERVTTRSDYNGAERACQVRGGTLATLRDPSSLSAIVAACAVGLPDDMTPCWTGIPLDREGPPKVFIVAPFQPTLAANDIDRPSDPGQGFYVVCELPGG